MSREAIRVSGEYRLSQRHMSQVIQAQLSQTIFVFTARIDGDVYFNGKECNMTIMQANIIIILLQLLKKALFVIKTRYF